MCCNCLFWIHLYFVGNQTEHSQLTFSVSLLRPLHSYPFNDSEHATLFVKISRGQFQIPECLSSKARCMIRSLLRRDPTERIASEDLLLHPWMKLDDRRDHSPPASYGTAPSAASILYQRSLSAASDQCVPEVNFAAAEERDDDDDDADDADYNNDNHDGDEYAATPLHH